jgi:hypothetical protein
MLNLAAHKVTTRIYRDNMVERIIGTARNKKKKCGEKNPTILREEFHKDIVLKVQKRKRGDTNSCRKWLHMKTNCSSVVSKLFGQVPQLLCVGSRAA